MNIMWLKRILGRFALWVYGGYPPSYLMDMEEFKMARVNVNGEVIFKGYSEEEIREAVKVTAQKYIKSYDKMSFAEMVLVENVLMNLEMELFCGDICKEDLE